MNPNEDIARQVLNAYHLEPQHIGFGGEILRSHRERREGWRGLIDLVLRRRPIRVIDELRLDEVSIVSLATMNRAKARELEAQRHHLEQNLGRLFPPPEFVCPRCDKPSWNPNDRIHGWCAMCQDYTAEPRP